MRATSTATNAPAPTDPMNTGRWTAFRARAVSQTGRGIARGNSPVICAMNAILSGLKYAASGTPSTHILLWQAAGHGGDVDHNKKERSPLRPRSLTIEWSGELL